jgi:hypothetical protein
MPTKAPCIGNEETVTGKGWDGMEVEGKEQDTQGRQRTWHLYTVGRRGASRKPCDCILLNGNCGDSLPVRDTDIGDGSRWGAGGPSCSTIRRLVRRPTDVCPPKPPNRVEATIDARPRTKLLLHHISCVANRRRGFVLVRRHLSSQHVVPPRWPASGHQEIVDSHGRPAGASVLAAVSPQC